jgi:hypothetical protein
MRVLFVRIRHTYCVCVEEEGECKQEKCYKREEETVQSIATLQDHVGETFFRNAFSTSRDRVGNLTQKSISL